MNYPIDVDCRPEEKEDIDDYQSSDVKYGDGKRLERHVMQLLKNNSIRLVFYFNPNPKKNFFFFYIYLICAMSDDNCTYLLLP